MNDLDTYVQTTLKDHSISPWRRAKEAAHAVRAQVLADEGLEEDTFLPIPLEWEHRVSGLDTRPGVLIVPDSLMDNVTHIGIYTDDPAPTSQTIVLDEPVVLDGEGSHDEIAAELMKEAFDAQFIGDEDLAQQRFDKFWERDS